MNNLILEGNAENTTLYTNAMNNTAKEHINRKLPDRIYMTLAKYDISTVLGLKQVAQREGLYEETITDKNISIPLITTKTVTNIILKNKLIIDRIIIIKLLHQLFNEFTNKLNQGIQQNPLNYQKPIQTQNQSPFANQPTKRVRESNSGQSKMDRSENFHQAASDQPNPVVSTETLTSDSS